MIIKYLLYSICALLSTKEGFGLPTGVELLANLRNSDFFYDLGKAIPTKSGNNTIRQLSVSQFPTLAYTGISYTLFEFHVVLTFLTYIPSIRTVVCNLG